MLKQLSSDTMPEVLLSWMVTCSWLATTPGVLLCWSGSYSLTLHWLLSPWCCHTEVAVCFWLPYRYLWYCYACPWLSYLWCHYATTVYSLLFTMPVYVVLLRWGSSLPLVTTLVVLLQWVNSLPLVTTFVVLLHYVGSLPLITTLVVVLY